MLWDVAGISELLISTWSSWRRNRGGGQLFRIDGPSRLGFPPRDLVPPRPVAALGTQPVGAHHLSASDDDPPGVRPLVVSEDVVDSKLRVALSGTDEPAVGVRVVQGLVREVVAHETAFPISAGHLAGCGPLRFGHWQTVRLDLCGLVVEAF